MLNFVIVYIERLVSRPRIPHFGLRILDRILHSLALPGVSWRLWSFIAIPIFPVIFSLPWKKAFGMRMKWEKELEVISVSYHTRTTAVY